MTLLVWEVRPVRVERCGDELRRLCAKGVTEFLRVLLLNLLYVFGITQRERSSVREGMIGLNDS